jgi:hypothetical protein
MIGFARYSTLIQRLVTCHSSCWMIAGRLGKMPTGEVGASEQAVGERPVPDPPRLAQPRVWGGMEGSHE